LPQLVELVQPGGKPRSVISQPGGKDMLGVAGASSEVVDWTSSNAAITLADAQSAPDAGERGRQETREQRRWLTKEHIDIAAIDPSKLWKNGSNKSFNG
jgi:hypothetical protein